MLTRSRRARAGIATAAVAGLVAGAPVVALTTAPSASAGLEVFAPQLVTVDTPTRAHKQRLQKLGLDLTEHAGHDYVEVVLHSLADLRALREAGLAFDVRIPDLLRREAENNAVNEAFAAATVRSALPSGRDAYRTLADYNADMARLAEEHPNLVKRFTLPHRSLDGRPVHGVEIGRNVRGPETGKPVFVMLGVHHAREWPSGEHTMEFAFDLVRNYGRDPRITRLVDRSRVVVVPVVNVDGFHLSRTDGGAVDLREVDRGGTVSILGTPGNAYKRKNCRLVDGQDTPDGSCRLAVTSPGGYGVGIDPNRNYGGFWGGPGASDLSLDPTYRGAAAFSEPETQNIRELVSGRQVTTLITNHTFSNLVLRPNGVHPDTIGPDGLPVGDAPDEAAMKALGDRMAAQNGYVSQHAWELYDTTGSTEDWSYNATGGFGYTFEIGPHEFHPPFPEVVDEYLGAGEYAGKGNREAYLIALENAVDPSAHSVIRGRAPRGAVLRLTKTVTTPTWESSVTDTLETTMKVRTRKGRFAWHVNPSTSPLARGKTVETTEETTLREETFEGGPVAPAGHADHELTVTETDVDRLRVSLDWPLPDDYDLEVYRRQADGSLTPVGSSGNMPGEKEQVEVADPVPGTYVLRVVNFAALSPYTLTATLLDTRVTGTEVVPGRVERWTLTCERKGQVLQRRSVLVDRGEQVTVRLDRCVRRWRGR